MRLEIQIKKKYFLFSCLAVLALLALFFFLEKNKTEGLNKETGVAAALSALADVFPQTGKNVELKISGDEHACAEINSELFEWVIENLIKNALDAIENKKGKIEINIKEAKKFIEIEISDNGKGIDMKRRKDIFRPGYSTKRRGWGLGLSLSRRIIEDYHGGKIFVKNSTPGEGTTFKILLNKAE